jgi:hypothetical protein
MITHQDLFNWLVKTAQAQKVTTYLEIAGRFGWQADIPQYQKLGGILSEISCSENAKGRPLLSAVAVLPEIGYPSKGFFLLARELGVSTCCDERSFFYHELKRVHAFWKQVISNEQAPELTRVFFRPVGAHIFS